MLAIGFAAVLAAAVRDLSLPFPRQPPASQLIEQLARAADAQAEAGDPADVQDVYGRSEWLSGFEAEIARHLGKERGLFFPTGVAAQNAALAVYAELPFRSHRTQPPPSFVMHATSHLHRYEEAAYSELLGLTALLAGDEARVLCARDVAIHLERLAAVGSAPCTVLIELPHRELGCATVPWEELLELRRLADQYEVALHLDGARLWEVAPYYKRTAGASIADIAALFDSVYVSFYKGLGGLTGAMLVGRTRFIEAAMPWRRRLGANPYTVMPYALSCRDAFRRHQHTFDERWQKLRKLVPLLTAAAQAEGGSLRTVPAEPQCCQVQVVVGASAALVGEAVGDDALMAAMDAARDAVDADLGVRVYSRLIGAPSADPDAAGRADSREADEGEPDGMRELYFEWCLGPAHVQLEDQTFVEAWTAFFRALSARMPI